MSIELQIHLSSRATAGLSSSVLAGGPVVVVGDPTTLQDARNVNLLLLYDNGGWTGIPSYRVIDNTPGT